LSPRQQRSSRRVLPVDSLALGRDYVAYAAIEIFGLDRSGQILLAVLAAESARELEEERGLSDLDSTKYVSGA
jgi:hypothetical protein